MASESLQGMVPNDESYILFVLLLISSGCVAPLLASDVPPPNDAALTNDDAEAVGTTLKKINPQRMQTTPFREAPTEGAVSITCRPKEQQLYLTALPAASHLRPATRSSADAP